MLIVVWFEFQLDKTHNTEERRLALHLWKSLWPFFGHRLTSVVHQDKMDLPDCPPGAEGYEDSVVEVPKKPGPEEAECTKVNITFYY